MILKPKERKDPFNVYLTGAMWEAGMKLSVIFYSSFYVNEKNNSLPFLAWKEQKLYRKIINWKLKKIYPDCGGCVLNWHRKNFQTSWSGWKVTCSPHWLLPTCFPKYASTLYKFELGRFKDSIREHTHKISHHCKSFEIMKTHLVM